MYGLAWSTMQAWCRERSIMVIGWASSSMVTKSSTCPLCKTPITAGVTIDLTTGTIVTKTGTIKMQPRAAEVLYLLWEAWPHEVSRERLCYRMDPQGNFNNGALKVHVSVLRKALLPHGIDISRFAREGYRLEMGEHL